MKTNNMYQQLEKTILNANLSDEDKSDIMRKLMKLKGETLNIMVTGATGCGKSSTINALFDTNVATVGVGADPQTMSITKYELDNLILWDTPGLGDGIEADNNHAKNIISKLAEVDNTGKALIDLILVILDGSSRDLGTSYELINEVIIPNLGPGKDKRILVAINQADLAMKGRHWNREQSKPDDVLQKFLEEKAESVQRRILETTGVNVNPICYSAGWSDADGSTGKPYNLSKLLYYIVEATPAEKRIIYASNTNSDSELWKSNDDLQDYGQETRTSVLSALGDVLSGRTGTWDGVVDAVFAPVEHALDVIDEVGSAVAGFIDNLFGW